MADSTIEWTTKTWNPTTGCTKISKECDNCYAEVMTNRCMHMPKHHKYKLGFGTTELLAALGALAPLAFIACTVNV